MKENKTRRFFQVSLKLQNLCDLRTHRVVLSVGNSFSHQVNHFYILLIKSGFFCKKIFERTFPCLYSPKYKAFSQIKDEF